jgi:hypothetical protein
MSRKRVTHGRHCTCSACAREDWARITGPCGMHGSDCPPVYAPIADPGHYPMPCADDERDRFALALASLSNEAFHEAMALWDANAHREDFRLDTGQQHPDEERLADSDLGWNRRTGKYDRR